MWDWKQERGPGSHRKLQGSVVIHVDGTWVAERAGAVGEDAKLR